MDLTGHIQDLITVAREMRAQPGSDKKAINKTIARLEEARLWSKEIQTGRLNGVPPSNQALNGSTESACTCPPGVVDRNCPIHSNN